MLIKAMTRRKQLKMPGLESTYIEMMTSASALAIEIDKAHPGIGQYALPLAFRRRSLLKMDAEQLQYMTELRTGPENHFSVREAAFEMYSAYAAKYPASWQSNLELSTRQRRISSSVNDIYACAVA